MPPRPGLPTDALARLIDACLTAGEGGLLAEPVADTVKRSESTRSGGSSAMSASAQAAMRVIDSVSRSGLWLAQTPQMFPAAALTTALQAAGAGESVTDEASAMERMGHRPLLVPGSPRNFKVTWPEHFELMEKWLG